MKLKKSRLSLFLGFLVAAALSIASETQALDFLAKTQNPSPGEGAYVGAFVGMGMGIVSADVTSQAGARGAGRRGTFKSERGGIGLEGIQGGGYLGYGVKTADDIYLGFEIGGAASDEKFEITSSVGLQDADGQSITKGVAERNWVAGGALRVGYYVNAETLFALKGGIAVSQFDTTVGTDKETHYAGGPQIGGSIETRLSKVDPNLSLRMEFVYTDYLTADLSGLDGVGEVRGDGIGNSEITGSDQAGRIGIQYTFW